MLFAVDITAQLTDFDLKLQGKNKHRSVVGWNQKLHYKTKLMDVTVIKWRFRSFSYVKIAENTANTVSVINFAIFDSHLEFLERFPTSVCIIFSNLCFWWYQGRRNPVDGTIRIAVEFCTQSKESWYGDI